MSHKLPWHKPTIRHLDARATAQTDLDAQHADPNERGDIPSAENSETNTVLGNHPHRQFDSH